MENCNIDAILNYLKQATVLGFQNILNNPQALIFFAAALVALYVYKKVRKMMWVVFIMIIFGYGSVLIDGFKILKQLAQELIDLP